MHAARNLSRVQRRGGGWRLRQLQRAVFAAPVWTLSVDAVFPVEAHGAATALVAIRAVRRIAAVFVLGARESAAPLRVSVLPGNRKCCGETRLGDERGKERGASSCGSRCTPGARCMQARTMTTGQPGKPHAQPLDPAASLPVLLIDEELAGDRAPEAFCVAAAQQAVRMARNTAPTETRPACCWWAHIASVFRRRQKESESKDVTANTGRDKSRCVTPGGTLARRGKKREMAGSCNRRATTCTLCASPLVSLPSSLEPDWDARAEDGHSRLLRELMP